MDSQRRGALQLGAKRRRPHLTISAMQFSTLLAKHGPVRHAHDVPDAEWNKAVSEHRFMTVCHGEILNGYFTKNFTFLRCTSACPVRRPPSQEGGPFVCQYGRPLATSFRLCRLRRFLQTEKKLIPVVYVEILRIRHVEISSYKCRAVIGKYAGQIRRDLQLIIRAGNQI